MTSAYQTPPMVQVDAPRRHLCAKMTVSNCHRRRRPWTRLHNRFGHREARVPSAFYVHERPRFYIAAVMTADDLGIRRVVSSISCKSSLLALKAFTGAG